MKALILAILCFNIGIELLRYTDVAYFQVKEVKVKKIEISKNYNIIKTMGHK